MKVHRYVCILEDDGRKYEACSKCKKRKRKRERETQNARNGGLCNSGISDCDVMTPRRDATVAYGR